MSKQVNGEARLLYRNIASNIKFSLTYCLQTLHILCKELSPSGPNHRVDHAPCSWSICGFSRLLTSLTFTKPEGKERLSLQSSEGTTGDNDSSLEPASLRVWMKTAQKTVVIHSVIWESTDLLPSVRLESFEGTLLCMNSFLETAHQSLTIVVLQGWLRG